VTNGLTLKKPGEFGWNVINETPTIEETTIAGWWFQPL
jgi:hypothetical protein